MATDGTEPREPAEDVQQKPAEKIEPAKEPIAIEEPIEPGDPDAQPI